MLIEEILTSMIVVYRSKMSLIEDNTFLDNFQSYLILLLTGFLKNLLFDIHY